MEPVLRRKLDALERRLREFPSCVIAFSGGVDSTLLARVAFGQLASQALALTGTSATTAIGEAERAAQVAAEIGIRHVMLETDEMDSPQFTAGGADRCYHCKRIRLAAIQDYARRNGFAVVVEGSNADDADDFRPGARAVAELGVLSPLREVGLAKNEIRDLSRALRLSTADRPATPCLATRIAYGEAITPERLRRIDAAEAYLAGLGFLNFRVRCHKDELARIELALSDLSRIVERPLADAVARRLLELGFRFVCVDLKGFRSGSMNRTLHPDASEE